ncbi:hypothetical protein QJR52_07045 [Clostridium baratii]|uniref:hypothetical protein n=1 Tax=Clostridium baratii TaxID=1561 RepID=UPI0030CCA734
MKVYKIYRQDRMGFEDSVVYSNNYNKALRLFNNLVRKEYSEVDVVAKEDFSEEVANFREWNREYEVVCRTYPLIMYRTPKSKKMIATIPFWEKTSYEYDEYDIESNIIVLEKIEIVE